MSIEFCQLQLDMNHNTTVDWNNYLREVCENTLIPHKINKIDEVDKIVKSLFTTTTIYIRHVLP